MGADAAVNDACSVSIDGGDVRNNRSLGRRGSELN
jgi:hypothetical protein